MQDEIRKFQNFLTPRPYYTRFVCFLSAEADSFWVRYQP